MSAGDSPSLPQRNLPSTTGNDGYSSSEGRSSLLQPLLSIHRDRHQLSACNRENDHYEGALELAVNVETYSDLPLSYPSKKFSCSLCGKKFREKRDLQRHTFIHDDKWPFRCPRCNQGFSCQGHLNTHLQIHTDEKRFVCAACNKAFVRADYLKRHIKRMHPDVATRVCIGSNHNEAMGVPTDERVGSTVVASAHGPGTVLSSGLSVGSSLHATTSFQVQTPTTSQVLTSHLQWQPQPANPVSAQTFQLPFATSSTRHKQLLFNSTNRQLSYANNPLLFSEEQEEPIRNRMWDEVDEDQPLDLSAKSNHH